MYVQLLFFPVESFIWIYPDWGLLRHCNFLLSQVNKINVSRIELKIRMSVGFGELPIYPNTSQLKVSQCDKKENFIPLITKNFALWE